MACTHLGIKTLSDLDLIKYRLISMVGTVQNIIDADPFNLDAQAVRRVVLIRLSILWKKYVLK